MSGGELYGVIACFADGDQLLRAIRAAAGRPHEAFTPTPLPGLTDPDGSGTTGIARAALAAAAAGAVGGMVMGWHISVVGYPLNVGGRPLAAWPAFVLPAFELAMLCGVLAALGVMLWQNGLPRLHHPILEHVTADRFCLCLTAGEPGFDPAEARRRLAEWGGHDIAEVGQRWVA
jgi:hypothetical protein